MFAPLFFATAPVKKSSSHDGTHVLVSCSEGVVVQRPGGGRYLFGTPPHFRLNVFYRGGEGILLALGDGVLVYVVAHGAHLKQNNKKKNNNREKKTRRNENNKLEEKKS